jgi:hypothetical protein
MIISRVPPLPPFTIALEGHAPSRGAANPVRRVMARPGEGRVSTYLGRSPQLSQGFPSIAPFRA